MRVVTCGLLLCQKRPEYINNLKQLTGILNFVIRIQDYKTSERIMQCLKCQNFCDKAEFCHIKNRCVKCAGANNTINCMTDMHNLRTSTGNTVNYQGCSETQTYKERRGTQKPPPSLSKQGSIPEWNSSSCLADN